jgi:hypothetical protein
MLLLLLRRWHLSHRIDLHTTKTLRRRRCLLVELRLERIAAARKP